LARNRKGADDTIEGVVELDRDRNSDRKAWLDFALMEDTEWSYSNISGLGG
jgi:hypothetical protein